MSGALCGLCGKNNGIKSDDLASGNGQLVSKSAIPIQKFVNLKRKYILSREKLSEQSLSVSIITVALLNFKLF